jgi:hypothetical protein
MPEKGYAVFHAPTSANPFLAPEEIALLRAGMDPLIASQELDALFVDIGGASIFPLNVLLVDGQPVDEAAYQYMNIGLAIDSNSGKGGEGRDGIAGVIFGGVFPNAMRQSVEGGMVIILDWDIQSLTQGGLAPWLMHMKERVLRWAYRLKPATGLPTGHVEPAGNGMSVIEVAWQSGMNLKEIDTKFVALGKDGRALAVEPHTSTGRVKLGQHAYQQRSNYKGVTVNHLVRQVTGFKTFDKEAYRREDDAYDAFSYSVLLTLGDGLETRWSRLKRAA